MTEKQIITIIIILASGIAILGLYIVVLNLSRRRSMKKLHRLGKIYGKKLSEIVEVIGEPDSVLELTNGRFCQWMQFSFHLWLGFDKDGICTEVDSKSRI